MRNVGLKPGDLLKFVWQPGNMLVDLHSTDSDTNVTVYRNDDMPTFAIYVGMVNTWIDIPFTAILVPIKDGTKVELAIVDSFADGSVGFVGKTVKLEKVENVSS